MSPAGVACGAGAMVVAGGAVNFTTCGICRMLLSKFCCAKESLRKIRTRIRADATGSSARVPNRRGFDRHIGGLLNHSHIRAAMTEASYRWILGGLRIQVRPIQS